jgi:excisionase family DNA binding protein
MNRTSGPDNDGLVQISGQPVRTSPDTSADGQQPPYRGCPSAVRPSDTQEKEGARTRRRALLESKPEPKLLSAQSAAEYMGLPYTTLRDLGLRGHVPVVRLPGQRRWWFRRADLDRLIEASAERAER